MRLFATLHESDHGTFETGRGALRMSVDRGRPEVVAEDRNDAFDPLQTKPPRDMVREKLANANPPFGDRGLGGLRGDKETLQILSLQGQHSLEFLATGHAFCVGETKHHRWQSA